MKFVILPEICVYKKYSNSKIRDKYVQYKVITDKGKETKRQGMEIRKSKYSQ